MTASRCLPIPTETATRWRQTGRDDRGHALIRRSVDGPGFPCRHCLQLGQPGQTMVLGSYDLPRPLGVHWTPSPIFLHAEAADCPRFEAADTVAPTVLANGLVSVRAYDAEDFCLYDLGQVVDGAAVAAPLARALADPRTRHVNIHTARPGCLLVAVEVRQRISPA